MVMLAERVAQRFAAQRHYRIDSRRLKRLNDPDTQAQQARDHGGYSKWRIEVVPIDRIVVPKVWKPLRFDKALAAMKAGKALDPINVAPRGSRFVIEDGIHRTNASLAMGYTHIPVFLSEWIETPEAFVAEEPQKPELALGSWVKLRKRFDGHEYGWVDEKLGPRAYRGVKRFWYGLALVSKGDQWPDFADFGDTEFDPVRAPPWGPPIQALVGIGKG